MATQGGAGSQLAALAAKRRTIDKTRQSLGLSSSPAGGTGQVRAPAPPPPQRATGESPVAVAPAPDAGAPAGERDPKLLEMAKGFLDSARNNGNAVAPAGPPIAMAPATQSPSLPDQITGVGGSGYSPEMQFMRLAGRPPSGREMVVFNATQQLTQQLGRPPTRNEVLMRVTNPVDLNQGPSPVSG